MSQAEILDLITTIVREELDNEDINLTLQTLASDVPGWDSLAHVRIVIAVEQKYGARFETAQITGLKNIGDLVSLVSGSKKF